MQANSDANQPDATEMKRKTTFNPDLVGASEGNVAKKKRTQAKGKTKLTMEPSDWPSHFQDVSTYSIAILSHAKFLPLL